MDDYKKDDYKKDDYKKEQQDEDDEDDEKIYDPCTCCFNCGWNELSRSEALGTIALWLQDFPLLLLGFLYAFSQVTCKTPDPKNITTPLFSIGISASAALFNSLWRLLLSLCYSGARHLDPNKICCCCEECHPNSSKVLYPPGKCAGCCYGPFCVCLVFKALAITTLAIITAYIWADYHIQTNERNFDDSLGIYRHSITSERGLLLFNISGNVIPPNGIFLHLENISYVELPEEYNNDVFCLSGFEYRPADFQIYHNALKLALVSKQGEFCVTIETGNDSTLCNTFYTQNYFASLDPVSGEIRAFDDECSVIKDGLVVGFAASRVDTNISIYQHLNRTGFPENGEPLVMFYSNLGTYHLVSDVILASNSQLQTVIVNASISGGTSLSCAVDFWYVENSGQIYYNYLDVINLGESDCQCSSHTNICEALHRNLVYGYLSLDQTRVTEYTHCSTISRDKLIPYYWNRIPVQCPCN